MKAWFSPGIVFNDIIESHTQKIIIIQSKTLTGSCITPLSIIYIIYIYNIKKTSLLLFINIIFVL